MAGVNKVILVGNLGIDPEVRTLENGTKLARIRIATSESYTAKDGQRIEQTEWHNVVLWRQLADVAERFLTKGKQVYIEGKLQTRQWKDRDGNDRYTTEVVADTLQLLGRAPSGNSSSQPDSHQGQSQQSQSQQSQSTTQTAAAQPQDDEDLPF